MWQLKLVTWRETSSEPGFWVETLRMRYCFTRNLPPATFFLYFLFFSPPFFIFFLMYKWVNLCETLKHRHYTKVQKFKREELGWIVQCTQTVNLSELTDPMKPLLLLEPAIGIAYLLCFWMWGKLSDAEYLSVNYIKQNHIFSILFYFIHSFLQIPWEENELT